MKSKSTIQAMFLAAFACATAAAFADGIRWEQAKDITSDADVRTDGVLRYAYSWQAHTVNGVPFSAGMSGHAANLYNIPDNTATLADITLSASSGRCVMYDYAFSGFPSTASEDYKAILSCFCYANEANARVDVELKNLIPGHAYIVQLWVYDNRNDDTKQRSIKVDDVSEVKYYDPLTGCGQHVTGSFTAMSDTQTFSLHPYGSPWPSAQFNAIQLRDVTPGCIEWEEPKDIMDDSDVRINGELVFAAGWCAATSSVNGVTFVPQNAKSELTIANVSVDGSIQEYRTDFNTGITQSLSDDYHRLMGGVIWGSGLPMTVNINGLTPGGRYLVQLWLNDSRSKNGPYRWASIDGGRRLAYRKASYGQHITGTFTADAVTVPIQIRPFYKGSSSSSQQLNAIQLRRLDSGASTHWRVSHISKSDYDVRLDGELLYAYNFTQGTTSAEVNGVTFAALQRTVATNYSNDNIALTFSVAGGNHASAFGFSDSGVTTGYLNLLKSATYGGPHMTLTLKKLVPGHRYLVQLWESDNRSTFDSRRVVLDGVATMRYRNANVFDPARGDVATGLFTATAPTHEIKMEASNASDASDTGAGQLNGLQVRDLGPATDFAYTVWAGGASGAWGEDATNWNDLAGDPCTGTLWDAANGGENIALFTAATSAALPSVDLKANGIVASGALTVGAVNDGRSVNVGFVEAQSCTFKSAWAADTLAKYDLGTFTLEGASPNLAKVVAGGGSLTLSRTDALKAGADVTVAKGATLTLADGSAPVLSRLAGDGTLVLDGMVTITNESAQAFTGTFNGDVVVRKAGRGDWTLGGTHARTLALDVLEGRVILATDGVAAEIAKDAVLDLGGATREIGAVSGNGTITNGTLSTALAVADGGDITLGAVTLSAGVTLSGTSSVTFAGDKDLNGIAVHVADPAAAHAAHKVIVAVEGELTGEPTFTFGTGGYKAQLADNGKGYFLTRRGLVVIVK